MFMGLRHEDEGGEIRMVGRWEGRGEEGEDRMLGGGGGEGAVERSLCSALL